MSAELQPYPEYKDTGIEWLGEIPSHWELKVGHAAFTPKQVKNVGLREKTVLSLSYGRIVVKPQEKLHGLVPESFETYQIVEPGDIIIRGTDLQNDKQSLRIGLSRYRGIITSAYICLKPSPVVSTEYAYQILNVYDLTKAIYAYGSGLRQNLDKSDLKRIPIFLPPRDEQDAIVAYLNMVDKRINRFIHNRRRLIEVLNEQKQAIINKAVTRGLDPNVPLKPSGIDWLGDIPENWEVVALRYLAKKFGSGVTPRGGATVYRESGIPFLRSQNIHFDELRLVGVARISPEMHTFLSATHVKPHDVLLNITGASIGRVCAVPPDFIEGNVIQHVCIIRPLREMLNSEYLASYLSSSFMQREIYIEQNGASREGLSLDAIRAFKIVVPPLGEQKSIVNSIKSDTESLVKACVKAQREIDLIHEYRTRLISDVVTGKVDVRHLAPAPGSEDLEEKIDELEPLDEAASELGEEALAGEVSNADR